MSTHEWNDHGRWVRDIVARYEGPLVRYASRITGDVERARDVVQETFLRLCRQERSEVDGHLAEWLFTVCRHRALDVQRKEGRMTTLTPQAAAAQASPDPDQAAVAERRDSARQIQHVIAHLPENQQEVVRLKFQNGLSYREISRIMQLSVSNVGYLIHTAIRKIRAELQVEPDGRTS